MCNGKLEQFSLSLLSDFLGLLKRKTHMQQPAGSRSFLSSVFPCGQPFMLGHPEDLPHDHCKSQLWEISETNPKCIISQIEPSHGLRPHPVPASAIRPWDDAGVSNRWAPAASDSAHLGQPGRSTHTTPSSGLCPSLQLPNASLQLQSKVIFDLLSPFPKCLDQEEVFMEISCTEIKTLWNSKFQDLNYSIQERMPDHEKIRRSWHWPSIIP